jgi:hypothetical protein
MRPHLVIARPESAHEVVNFALRSDMPNPYALAEAFFNRYDKEGWPGSDWRMLFTKFAIREQSTGKAAA